jgi:hypothetical protein
MWTQGVSHGSTQQESKTTINVPHSRSNPQIDLITSRATASGISIKQKSKLPKNRPKHCSHHHHITPENRDPTPQSITFINLLPLLRPRAPIPHLIRHLAPLLQPRLLLREDPRLRLIVLLLAKAAPVHTGQLDQRAAELRVSRDRGLSGRDGNQRGGRGVGGGGGGGEELGGVFLAEV